jgi:serine/threonine-protein kinase
MVSLLTARRINDSCERFEAAWRAGERPRIEDGLNEAPGPARAAAFFELLVLELELRREAGEQPIIEDYRDRFPDHLGVIDAAFEAAASLTGQDPASTISFDGPRPAAPPTGASGPDRAPPYRFGDYELHEEIARGGMGVVYKARQVSLQRDVALKMILSGPFASPIEMERFRRESEAAANLDHPNLLPIYEVGEHEGQHFFSMKLIEGESLAKRVPRLVPDPWATARLLVKVARAVDHAHARGFLHRDLKPHNILLDSRGEPYVTDFGLARRVEEESCLTRTGTMVGTPCYMAPEQASGQRRVLTARADVYSLGAILYELLTGQPPFRAATVMETVVQVLEREPAAPRRIRPEVSHDLELICLKCLEKAPEARYPTAAALADDLDRFLRGEDVAARRAGFRVRLRRWVRRETALAFRLAGLGLIAGLTAYNHWRRPGPDPTVYGRVMATLAIWALASLAFQGLLRAEWRVRWIRPAWLGADVVLLTVILRLLEAWGGTVVVGYPLLVAASGLWFRVRLVWFTTLLAEAAYAALLLDAWARGVPDPADQWPNIFMASLLVTGFVVAQQVKRLWALSFYYEHREEA